LAPAPLGFEEAAEGTGEGVVACRSARVPRGPEEYRAELSAFKQDVVRSNRAWGQDYMAQVHPRSILPSPPPLAPNLQHFFFGSVVCVVL